MKNGKHLLDLDELARQSAQAAIQTYEDRERKQARNMRCAVILATLSLLATVATATHNVYLLERVNTLDARIIKMESYARNSR